MRIRLRSRLVSFLIRFSLFLDLKVNNLAQYTNNLITKHKFYRKSQIHIREPVNYILIN